MTIPSPFHILRFSDESVARIATVFLLTGLLSILTACNSTRMTEGLRSADSPSLAQQQTDEAPRPSELVTSGSVSNETALAAQEDATPGAQAALQQGDQSAAQAPPVAFLPVTGAPQSAVSKLAASMREAAKSKSVPIVVSVDEGAQYQVKGYFSALDDGSGTLLVYVWDILDRSGTRVHRISGQERGNPASGDPWTGITHSMIDQVANSTMTELRSWTARL